MTGKTGWLRLRRTERIVGTRSDATPVQLGRHAFARDRAGAATPAQRDGRRRRRRIPPEQRTARADHGPAHSARTRPESAAGGSGDGGRHRHGGVANTADHSGHAIETTQRGAPVAESII